MGYLPKHIKVRRHEKEEHDNAVIIAKAALAGWRWELGSRSPTGLPYYRVYAPNGLYHGFNDSILGAARYALGEMQRWAVEADRPQRQGWRATSQHAD